MKRKHFYTIALISTVFLTGCSQQTASRNDSASALAYRLAGMQTASGEESTFTLPPLKRGMAGKYLSSHFAQSQYDWVKANNYLGEILEANPENEELVRRSMILAMGSGDMIVATQRAQQLLNLDTGDDSLPLMILAVNHMAEDEMDEAIEKLDQMPGGDMTDFVKPILKGWAKAAQGKMPESETFNDTSIHLYHGALISTFLNDRENMQAYTEALMAAGTLSNTDAERAGDLLAALGHHEQALAVYEGLYEQNHDDKALGKKLAAIQEDNGGNIRELIQPLQIETARQGAALALYDMAYILYQEHSDSSTKLFVNMALALDPHLTNAHLLFADTLSRNGRLEEAIRQMGNVPEDHPSFLAVQRHAAELLAEVGREAEALEKLNRLFMEHNDVEALIRIGDLHRDKENYENALTAYNKAVKHIGGDIPEEFWYLLYARGMAYEREGDWAKAESDLKAALGYRPDHPYLLNYLGYGWADQGLNLEESLELIERAAALRPRDGYIIDSLGWVHFMMGNYSKSLPYLERAVELLPYDSTINDHLGDAYWRVGRTMEARFQWERALNYNEDDPSLSEKLSHKLRFGLEGMDETKHAGTK